MALLNANYMGLYALSKGSTDPFTIGVGATSSAAISDAWTKNGSTTGDAILVDSIDDVYKISGQPAIASVTSSSAASPQALSLLAAATSTSLDLSNTVNEVVARDGSCGSETFIVSGAQSWTLSADGLIQTGGVAGYGAMNLMDYARAGEYVFVRFVLNNAAMDDATDNDENVSYLGQALIESVSLSGGFDETSTYSVSLSGYGKLYKYQA